MGTEDSKVESSFGEVGGGERAQTSMATMDPLTWSVWCKIGITLNICANAFLNNMCAAGLVPTLSAVAQDLDIPITTASNLMAYNVLAQGLGNLIWVPTMLCFGKRWTITTTMVLMLPCIAWAAESKSYNSLLAARIVSGFASGASESFAPAIIGDIWHEHNLTTVLGFFSICVIAGAGLGQTILGFVTQGAGWRWAYWVTFITCAVNFLTMLIWLPETTYQRGLTVGVTAGDIERSEQKLNRAGKSCPPVEEAGQASSRHQAAESLTSMRPNLWFLRHPHVTYDEDWLRCFLRPFHFTLSVPALWVSLLYAVTAGAFTAVGVCVPQLLGPPPYNFNAADQGLFGLSSLVGVILGGSVGSKMVDVFNARIEAKRLQNNENHKPEERLVMLILPMLTVPVGLIMYGVTIKQELPWIAPAVGYTIHSFGISSLAAIAFSYAVDAYLIRSGEVMVFINTCRALISFGFVNFTPNWLVKVGPEVAYSVLAAVVWGLMFLGIPIYFMGPKLRALTNRFL